MRRCALLAALLMNAAAVGALACSKGAKVAIGTLRARGAISGRKLLEFLIAAGAIRTYWHIGAELCIEDERAADGSYQATVSGVHTYFTHEKNRDEIAFVFGLAADGSMTIERK